MEAYELNKKWSDIHKLMSLQVNQLEYSIIHGSYHFIQIINNSFRKFSPILPVYINYIKYLNSLLLLFVNTFDYHNSFQTFLR